MRFHDVASHGISLPSWSRRKRVSKRLLTTLSVGVIVRLSGSIVTGSTPCEMVTVASAGRTGETDAELTAMLSRIAMTTSSLFSVNAFLIDRPLREEPQPTVHRLTLVLRVRLGGIVPAR